MKMNYIKNNRKFVNCYNIEIRGRNNHNIHYLETIENLDNKSLISNLVCIYFLKEICVQNSDLLEDYDLREIEKNFNIKNTFMNFLNQFDTYKKYNEFYNILTAKTSYFDGSGNKFDVEFPDNENFKQTIKNNFAIFYKQYLLDEHVNIVTYIKSNSFLLMLNNTIEEYWVIAGLSAVNRLSTNPALILADKENY